MEKEELLNKINKILDDLKKEIDFKYLKIREESNETHFTNQYIITLRDDYFENEGRRDMLNIIKNKIYELKKEE